MISTDETRVTPAANGGFFQERICGRGICRERGLRQIEFFGGECAEKSFDSLRANLDVVVEKQDRTVTEKQIRP